jgi:hypothetical protein
MGMVMGFVRMPNLKKFLAPRANVAILTTKDTPEKA